MRKQNAYALTKMEKIMKITKQTFSKKEKKMVANIN